MQGSDRVKGESYKYYLLVVLTLVGVVSTFERFVFALALEPIKVDLQLSDTQLGFMTGIAFALFYGVAGIPIARWADRGNRVNITGLAVALLGVMVTLCGLVGNFFQLLLVRAGVAVGEAGFVPSAQSLLADYFDRRERPRAMSFYLMFYTISMIIGYWLGGWLIDSIGWRRTFLVLGIPSFLVALLVKVSLKEPRLDKPISDSTASDPFIETLLVLWRQPSFKHIFIAFCVSYFFSLGVSQWNAVFFIRSHKMEISEIGAWFALMWGVLGTLGNFVGGYYASRYAGGKEKLQMRLVAVVFAVTVVTNLMVYLSSTTGLALFFVGATAFLTSLVGGPIFATIQTSVGEGMRSVAIALIYMFANIIGFGLGPLMLGFVSDLLNPALGQESLRYALVLFCPGTLWVATHYWIASNNIEVDINNAQVQMSEPDTP